MERHPSDPTGPPFDPAPTFLVEVPLAALDTAVVVYAALILLCFVIGPFQIGPLGFHLFSKPFLVFVALAAIRAAIPQPSWLTRTLGRLREQLVQTADELGSRTPWSGALLDAAVAVLSVQVLLKGVTFFAVLHMDSPRRHALPFSAQRFAETFAAWDSRWYFDIAHCGYSYSRSAPSSIAFFPLYPMLMRAMAWPFGGGAQALWVAGIVLSYVCLFLGLAVLHRLCRRIFEDRECARRTVLYVAVFPFAYFFTSVYTESLFLLVTVSAVAAAMASRWGWAGFFGGLSALTRPNGILIALPLAMLALEALPSRRALLRRAGWLALVPLAFGIYCWFNYRLAGDPLAWLHAQDQWDYTLGNRPWGELMRLIDSIQWNGLYGYFVSGVAAPFYFIHGMAALLFVALLPAVSRRVGTPLTVYAAVSLLVPLTGDALEGIGRYGATLFPFFMTLGAATSKRGHEAVLIASALALAVFASLFTAGYPLY